MPSFHRRTLSTLIVNTVENVENKILEVLDVIGERMAPVIQKFLFEGSSLLSYGGRDVDSLIGYLDKNMLLLKEKLNEANFEKVLSIIWESSAKSLSDTIHVSIEVRAAADCLCVSIFDVCCHFSVRSRPATSAPCTTSSRCSSTSSTATGFRRTRHS